MVLSMESSQHRVDVDATGLCSGGGSVLESALLSAADAESFADRAASATATSLSA